MQNDKERSGEILREQRGMVDAEEYVKCWGLRDRSEYLYKEEEEEEEGKKWEAGERVYADSMATETGREGSFSFRRKLLVGATRSAPPMAAEAQRD